MTFKLAIEILSSIASLVAIVAVLGAWLNSIRKPLKVERVVIHRKKDSTVFILLIKNRKTYPVEIKKVRCFTHRDYKVEQRQGSKPEYLPSLNYKYGLFLSESDEAKHIGANGFTDIRYEIDKKIDNDNFSQFLFDMDTSHGFYLLKCKDIELVDIGVVTTYEMKYSRNYESKIKAYARFCYLKLLYLLNIKQ